MQVYKFTSDEGIINLVTARTEADAWAGLAAIIALYIGDEEHESNPQIMRRYWTMKMASSSDIGS